MTATATTPLTNHTAHLTCELVVGEREDAEGGKFSDCRGDRTCGGGGAGGT